MGTLGGDEGKGTDNANIKGDRHEGYLSVDIKGSEDAITDTANVTVNSSHEGIENDDTLGGDEGKGTDNANIKGDSHEGYLSVDIKGSEDAITDIANVTVNSSHEGIAND